MQLQLAGARALAKPEDKSTAKPTSEAKAATTDQKPIVSQPRKIPGNLPYLAASGTLKKALDRIVEAPRPDKVNYDFLENILKIKGGSARSAIPILKRIGLVSSEGAPTDLYVKFQTQGGRGAAALAALRFGFAEVFRRSAYAHVVDDAKLRDLIQEITGLKSTDPVSIAIRGTFNVIKGYIPAGFDASPKEEEIGSLPDAHAATESPPAASLSAGHVQRPNIGLVYNINVVLPETSDVKILNAIFKSLKENLLQ